MYLGSRVTNDADCADGVKLMAMAMTVKLMKTCKKNKPVSTSTVLQLMKALVWPVVTYGCEACGHQRRKRRGAFRILRTSALESC